MLAEFPDVLAILGPTASGKTDLAIGLAQQLDGEIITVDSAQVYRGMDIGTAKPTEEELAQAPHHLLDICDPAESYSAADFVRDAQILIQEIKARGRLPILAGGTMLYFKALLEGLSPMPKTDEHTRREIETEAEIKGWPAMHAELVKVDPDTAAQLHPNHSQRIGRALEVFRISGKTISQWRGQKNSGLLEQMCVCQIALAPRERSVLHQRIELRFDKMLAEGFIDEVKKLFERGDLNTQMPSVRAVGYRQAWDYLTGELNWEEMRANGIAATRQLAKRQLTWLRSWHDLRWIDTQASDGKALQSCEILRQALNQIGTRAI